MAIAGISTVYGIPRMLTRDSRVSDDLTGVNRDTYRNPVPSSCMTLVSRGTFAFRTTFISSNETMTAMYDTPSAKKHHPSPTAAITIPPMLGPRIRLTLTIDELRAMALG